MPDGYSVDLDQFQGLDQIGEQGLKDKVNNHYLQIFGTSIAWVWLPSEPNHAGWRHHYHEWFPGVYQRGSGQRFAVCGDHP